VKKLPELLIVVWALAILELNKIATTKITANVLGDLNNFLILDPKPFIIKTGLFT